MDYLFLLFMSYVNFYAFKQKKGVNYIIVTSSILIQLKEKYFYKYNDCNNYSIICKYCKIMIFYIFK